MSDREPGTIVWVEALVPNDIGAHGKAIVVEDEDERTTVKMLNGNHTGMTLSIPHAGVLPYVPA